MSRQWPPANNDVLPPFLPYDRAKFLESLPERPQSFHDLATRPGLVFYLISNCKKGVPSERMKYIKELSKYVQVDGYGKCGPLHCSIGDLASPE